HVYLTDGHETLYERDEAIRETVKLLEEGYIVAVKGIGGCHLCCITEDEPVLTLRERLNRKSQPFAIMSMLENVEKFAYISKLEREVLISNRRPIVVLKKRKGYDKYISKYVSNLDTIGVMLPYSGLHYLLFNKAIAYVFTSANLPGLPMVKDNEDILNKMNGIADYFLLHNRRIVNRCDDSVVKKVADRIVFLRRSRGYAPEPVKVKLDNNKTILCLGAELNSCVCLAKRDNFYLSQYIGNTAKYETFLYLKEAIFRLLELTNTKKVDVIACDLHPTYNSTKLAQELQEIFDCDLIRVQHHFAHAYSLLGDNNYFEDAIILALDGMGYGLDGNVWGGEVLLYRDGEIKRVSHLEEQYQLGGDLAVKYPARMLFSILYKAIKEEALEFMSKYFPENMLRILEFQLKKKINCPITTSTGRVLDAVSALLEICLEKTYDGEPAIRLEAEVKKDDVEVEPRIKNNILITTDMIKQCYEMLINGESKGKIAYYAHLYIADGLFEIFKKLSEKYGINTIGLTGGVSYNRVITERIYERANEEGYNFIYHRNVPNGDGGVSFGQAIYYIKERGKNG
ncbi:(NiFe) hydrogenase maturation protein HypF, partial [Methanocaldococcus villosus KIN24-T80]